MHKYVFTHNIYVYINQYLHITEIFVGIRQTSCHRLRVYRLKVGIDVYIFIRKYISMYIHRKYMYTCMVNICILPPWYGVATISRMLKNKDLFCKRALQKRPVFCKETCIFKHPTHRSHPITYLHTYIHP